MNLKSIFANICAMSLIALSLSGCNGDKKSAETIAPAAVISDPNLVTPPSTVVARITVAPVANHPIEDVLRVAGQVDFDERRIARIGSTVTGRVLEIKFPLLNP